METKEQAATRRHNYNIQSIRDPQDRRRAQKKIKADRQAAREIAQQQESRVLIKETGETKIQYQRRVNDALDRYIMNAAALLGLVDGQKFVDTHTRTGTKHPFDSEYQDSDGKTYVKAISVNANTTELYWYKK